VLKDYRTAPISEAERSLFAFVDKVNRQSNQIRREDIEEARAAGWDDEALYDAMTVCALFNFYNRWVDASGVHICLQLAMKCQDIAWLRKAMFGQRRNKRRARTVRPPKSIPGAEPR